MSFGPSQITAFHAVYPGIVVELSALTERVSLSRRDADVAIRPTNTPPDSVVGRRVARIAMAVYAARAGRDPPRFASPAFWQGPWLDGDENLAHLSSAQIGRAHFSTPVPNPPLVCRLLLAQKKA